MTTCVQLQKSVTQVERAPSPPPFFFLRPVVKLMRSQFATGKLEKTVLMYPNADISSFSTFTHPFGLLYSPCSEITHSPVLVLA